MSGPRAVASAFNGNRVAAGTPWPIGRFPQDRAALAPWFHVETRTWTYFYVGRQRSGVVSWNFDPHRGPVHCRVVDKGLLTFLPMAGWSANENGFVSVAIMVVSWQRRLLSFPECRPCDFDSFDCRFLTEVERHLSPTRCMQRGRLTTFKSESDHLTLPGYASQLRRSKLLIRAHCVKNRNTIPWNSNERMFDVGIHKFCHYHVTKLEKKGSAEIAF